MRVYATRFVVTTLIFNLNRSLGWLQRGEKCREHFFETRCIHFRVEVNNQEDESLVYLARKQWLQTGQTHQHIKRQIKASDCEVSWVLCNPIDGDLSEQWPEERRG